MEHRLDHPSAPRQSNVLVIGAGYAGVMAANRMTKRDDLAVTLVNPRPTFVHRIRLQQLLADTDSGEAVVDLSDMLAERVRLVVDSVTQIRSADRSVTLASGETLDYDYLVYAVGSGSGGPKVPGAAEFAYPMATLEEAQRARSALEAAPATAPVTVVGGGALGIEVASELAAMGRDVTLVCGEVLNPYLHPRIRRKIAKKLVALGVTLIDGPGAIAARVERDAVQLSDGRRLPSTVTIWTAGFSLPDLAARSGLSTDADGRLLTDETLTSVDDPRIFAAGDSAAPSDLPLRMSCQAAHPLGAHVADNVLRRISGEELAPINVGVFFSCISLGPGAATVQLASRQDVANRFAIGGRLGAKIKYSSFPAIVKELAHEGLEPGSYKWPMKNPKRQRQIEDKRGKALAATR
jgi:NADH dehydrogenase FAD-containing subunit